MGYFNKDITLLKCCIHESSTLVRVCYLEVVLLDKRASSVRKIVFNDLLED